MARRAKTARRTRTVTADFKGVDSSGGRVHIPEGDYLMRVDSADQEESREGNEMIHWIFEGLEGKSEKKKFHVYTSLLPEALWKLRGLLEALGVEVPDSELDIDLDEMIDLELICSVTDEEYENKISSKVTDWEAAEEEKPSKPARGRAKKEEEEEIDEKPARRKRARNGGGKAVKVSSDEVRAMDEDELADLIDKHSLGVDLAKERTPRKKIAAVIEALEAEDLLEE